MTQHSVRAGAALRGLIETDPAMVALSLWCDHRDGEGRLRGPWTPRSHTDLHSQLCHATNRPGSPPITSCMSPCGTARA